MVNMNLVRGLSKVEGGRASATAVSIAAQSLVTAPAPTETVAAPSPSEVEKIPPEEVTQKVSKSFGKCPTEALSDQRKKTKVSGWHKSCCEGEKSRPHAVEGERPTAPAERTLAPRARP
ncbi:hypothetical protein BHE74_00020745 [Ensete ventricosum]|nr:hypothetical protein BHE74_00020745 [Ensete ventricosum]RZR88481.1 hypothetical protein BHM03_00016061 [Ensete ventricosum]